jgi:hypothetical protein
VIVEAERVSMRSFHVPDLEAMTDVFGDPGGMWFGPEPQSRNMVQGWLLGCLED